MSDEPIDGWNHNAHYHAFLLSAVPRPCLRALDVGCGLGAFARRLARNATEVDAIDRDAEVLRRARERSSGLENLHFIEADFLSWQTSDRYDFMSFVATLHHLPFGAAIAKAKSLLVPGGVLAVLGLDRAPHWLDAGMRAAVACPVSAYHRLTRPTASVGAPLEEPTMTFGQIRREAERELEGSTLRRHVLWRYSLIWIKPGTG